MHLNEHGWGLKEMLIWVVVILAFLLVAVFYISKLYTGIDEKSNYSNDVIDATNEYLYNVYGTTDVTSNMYIPVTVLDEETSFDFKNCTGFVEVKLVDGKTKIVNKVECN